MRTRTTFRVIYIVAHGYNKSAQGGYHFGLPKHSAFESEQLCAGIRADGLAQEAFPATSY